MSNISKLSKMLVVAIFCTIMILSTQAQAQAQAVKLQGRRILQDQQVPESLYYANLKQSGSRVTGTYTRNGNVSTIRGRVEDGKAILFWNQPHNGKSGVAELFVYDSYKLSGPWYYGSNSDKKADGTWTFTRP
jgi:hypothetical protein